MWGTLQTCRRKCNDKMRAKLHIIPMVKHSNGIIMLWGYFSIYLAGVNGKTGKVRAILETNIVRISVKTCC